jgi:hypothetical protein
MFKEYRWQIKDGYKAIAKQQELRRSHGVKIPIFEIETNKGERFVSMVFPEGIVPKPRKNKLTF